MVISAIMSVDLNCYKIVLFVIHLSFTFFYSAVDGVSTLAQVAFTTITVNEQNAFSLLWWWRFEFFAWLVDFVKCIIWDTYVFFFFLSLCFSTKKLFKRDLAKFSSFRFVLVLLKYTLFKRKMY